MIAFIKKANPDILTPVYKTKGSAGADIHASEDATILSGESTMVPTGLFLEAPEGFECQVRSRSGLASKGIVVFNSPGTVDSDFRGEMKVLMYNATKWHYKIKKDDRIAQLIFAPVFQAKFTEVPELSKTDRGEGGWGSTGVR